MTWTASYFWKLIPLSESWKQLYNFHILVFYIGAYLFDNEIMAANQRIEVNVFLMDEITKKNYSYAVFFKTIDFVLSCFIDPNQRAFDKYWPFNQIFTKL